MIYTYSYDSNYLPAMPAVEIQIGRAQTDPFLSLSAIIDSGADASIVPLRYLQQVRARRGDTARMRGVTGSFVVIDLYVISLQIGPFVRAEVKVVANSQYDEVIIGRDLLNQFIITLNGLASVVEITQ